MESMLAIKSIFKVHILFYITGLICILNGYFKHFIIFTSIILIHELGHITGALIFKWNIEKVILLPFGGITIFNEKIDKPLKEEFIIAILGPIFQIIFYLLFKDNYTFSLYNKIILIFNLIPIYPLDGSKIVNILLNKFISFKKSHLITLYISLIALLIIFRFNLSLITILILFFIVKEIIIDFKKHKHYINKFLLEKYLYKKVYKKKKIIKNIYSMKKQTNHIVKDKNKYYLESEILIKMFDK